MLIRLFKTSHPVSYILLPVLALALRIPLFFEHRVSSSSGAFFFKNLGTSVAEHPYLYIVLSALLIGIAGAFLNYLSDTFGFLDRVSGLTGLAYVLMASMHPVASDIGADTLALLLVLAALHEVLSLTRDKSGFNKVFNAGFLLALSSLIQPALIGLELLVILAVIYFQTFNKRHVSLHIIGILVPLVYYAVYDLIWQEGSFAFDYVSMLIAAPWGFTSSTTWLVLLLPAFVLIWSFSAYLKSVSTNTMRRRKTLLLVLWILLVSFLLVVQAPGIHQASLSILAIPLAFILANYLFYARKTRLAEFFLLLIIAWELAWYWMP